MTLAQLAPREGTTIRIGNIAVPRWLLGATGGAILGAGLGFLHFSVADWYGSFVSYPVMYPFTLVLSLVFPSPRTLTSWLGITATAYATFGAVIGTLVESNSRPLRVGGWSLLFVIVALEVASLYLEFFVYA